MGGGHVVELLQCHSVMRPQELKKTSTCEAEEALEIDGRIFLLSATIDEGHPQNMAKTLQSTSPNTKEKI